MENKVFANILAKYSLTKKVNGIKEIKLTNYLTKNHH